MSPSESDKHTLARSFGSVADSYDSGRPDYPREAAAWLLGAPGARLKVLELGAGTGRLTSKLTGHQLLATDPSVEMLAKLRATLPDVPVAAAAAERLPTFTDAYDVVVVAQAFHWFDHELALSEIARTLRPDGYLALVWNVPDETTPWVRKLLRIVPRPVSHEDDVIPLRETALFGHVEEQRFRTWKHLDKAGLLEFIKSRSPYAVADEATREQMLADVSALYDDYGRGSAGLQMPLITHCFRAKVMPQAVWTPDPVLAHPREVGAEPGRAAAADTSADTPAGPPADPAGDDGTLLIDFR